MRPSFWRNVTNWWSVTHYWICALHVYSWKFQSLVMAIQQTEVVYHLLDPLIQKNASIYSSTVECSRNNVLKNSTMRNNRYCERLIRSKTQFLVPLFGNKIYRNNFKNNTLYTYTFIRVCIIFQFESLSLSHPLSPVFYVCTIFAVPATHTCHRFCCMHHACSVEGGNTVRMRICEYLKQQYRGTLHWKKYPIGARF